MKTALSILFALLCLAQTAFTPANCNPAFFTTPPAAEAGGGSGTFITSGHGLTTRNDFSGVVGMKFSPSANMTVTDLGRIFVSGNTGSHTVYLEDASGTVIVSASVSGGTADNYTYTSITPTALTAGTQYYLLSSEISGGDLWYENDADVTHTSAATISQSAFAFGPNIAPSAGTVGNRCYVPVNFKYTVP